MGSYATNTAGVGSDLDIVLVVAHSDVPLHQRSLAWDFSALPVAVDVLVYTLVEWQSMVSTAGRMATTLQQETIWVINRLAPRK
ncbi:MAG: nucleotidyltransferase domain-containing protein [Nodosilinea sp.]